MENHLPDGYANASPKTRLRSRAAFRTSESDGQWTLERLAVRVGPSEPVWSRYADGTP